MLSVQAKNTSDERLASLTRKDLPQQNHTPLEKICTYDIHDIKLSENAILFFNRNKHVFKMLRPYKDLRYSLKELSDRHACLLDGLYWNKLFSPDVYCGLARYYGSFWEQGRLASITLGETFDPNLEQKPLASDAEYVLVMKTLHSSDRLDSLLKKSDHEIQQSYISRLAEFLKDIYTNPVFSPDLSSPAHCWGSVEQLTNKLNNNLISVERPDVSDISVLDSAEYVSLLSLCRSLRETLLFALTKEPLRSYFVQRIEKKQIKRCHGDLKARNIWITSKGVRVLDAIDFNPEFCNIDILSDFAMLVADIYARTGSSELANSMIKDYLGFTIQEDEGSRFVLNYYLIEKAFVGALVSILYDRNRWLGQRYLDLCEWYLAGFRKNLPRMLQTAPALAH